MKHNQKWTLRLTALGLAAACLCGGAVLAAGGDQSDPLITLSYLTQTATPDILKQVDDQSLVRQTELLNKLNSAIADYKIQMDQRSGSGGGAGAAYVVVTLSSGQKLSLGVGAEVMLRVGTASVSAGTSTGLIDVTSGGVINNGDSLTVNHLYMATMTDRAVQATADTVKLLVRGEYTVA